MSTSAFDSPSKTQDEDQDKQTSDSSYEAKKDDRGEKFHCSRQQAVASELASQHVGRLRCLLASALTQLTQRLHLARRNR